MDFDSVLNLTIKRFWFLVNQADRLRAEQDLRQLQLLGSAADAEAMKVAVENQQREMGTVYVWLEQTPKEIRIQDTHQQDPEFDREGLRALKAMSELKVGEAV